MQDKIEEMEKLEILINQFQDLHEEYTGVWLDEVFLHWDWWISLIISVGTWIFWIFYRKKESTHRLLHAGIFAMLISIILCYIGSAFGLWYYTGKLTPTYPAWFPYNLSLLPVTIMFLIQTKPHIASWKKGIFYGLLTAFVGEPIFVWAGFYVMTGWEYIYSVPIYAIIFIVCDWLTKRDTFEKV
ncbi:CBO0543 family protein [Oceanobacillus luteolus]|uniref:CBO0543 family protein n=1 Tax=Oceanobacillus luteolus TaxID=1274358 RepID=A0ABW4HRD2_9BACI